MKYEPIVNVITFGEELLLGIRENKHLSYLASEFSHRGLKIRQAFVVSDHPDEIQKTFCEVWDRADIIITTGGLGSTSNDNTRKIIAKSFGLELEAVPKAEEALRERFKKIGRAVNERSLRQCSKPKGFDAMFNTEGTAIGLFYRQDGKILIMLPGPMHELKAMFESEVIPRLENLGVLQGSRNYLHIRSMGLGKSEIEDRLKTIIKKHKNLGVGYSVDYGIVDIRLSRNHEKMTYDELLDIGEACRHALADHFVCYGRQSLAKIVFDQLRATDSQIAVAESCTGGLLSNAFTDIPGISKVFSGGVVCYTNDAKIDILGIPDSIIQQHGAVNPETAIAMATAAAEKFSTHYALSTTGYAGPRGGTKEDPVGTVYFGLHSPLGVWSRRVTFVGRRVEVKQWAVNVALDWLRRQLIEHRVHDAVISGSL